MLQFYFILLLPFVLLCYPSAAALSTLLFASIISPLLLYFARCLLLPASIYYIVSFFFPSVPYHLLVALLAA